MAVFVYLVCLILALILFPFLYRFLYSNGLPRNLPFVGMITTILLNLNGLHQIIAEMMNQSNGTFHFKGIWFTNSSFLLTCHPDNVRYIMNTNFAAYTKGSEWRKHFDVFGESIFNSNGEEWKQQRRFVHALLNHPQFRQSLLKILGERLELGLIQVLDHVSKRQLVVDFNDLLVRLTSDIGWTMATGSNPRFLSIEFPENKFQEAISDVFEAIFYRVTMPDFLWKLQSWLQFGLEKKRSDACKYFDNALVEIIAMQREKSNKAVASSKDQYDPEEYFNLLNCLMTQHEVLGTIVPEDSFIRDNVPAFMFAMNDTTSLSLGWFFYLLSKNPRVVPKIREEIKRNLSMKKVGEFQVPESFDELSKLVYLQAALCETLRLYPPIPFELRESTRHDILPSGHRINPGMLIVLTIHAMGQMTWLWGEDCLEFKPERWITDEGKLKREQPTKFFAFISGPRICAGKELSFLLMKATASTIIHNFDVHVVEGQDMTPKNSAFLQTKHGMKASITGRSGHQI